MSETTEAFVDAADELEALRAENERLHAANKRAVERAVWSSLDRAELERLRAADKARAGDIAAIAVVRRAFDALAEVAIAVHRLLPADAMLDREGAAVIAAGRTQPQLFRALAELALALPPKEPT